MEHPQAEQRGVEASGEHGVRREGEGEGSADAASFGVVLVDLVDQALGQRATLDLDGQQHGCRRAPCC